MNTYGWLYLIVGGIGAIVYLILRLSGVNLAHAESISEKIQWVVLACVVIAFLSAVIVNRLN